MVLNGCLVPLSELSYEVLSERGLVKRFKGRMVDDAYLEPLAPIPIHVPVPRTIAEPVTTEHTTKHPTEHADEHLKIEQPVITYNLTSSVQLKLIDCSIYYYLIGDITQSEYVDYSHYCLIGVISNES